MKEDIDPLVRLVPVENVLPDPEQPRRGCATSGPAWEALVRSVREDGLLQPLVVRPRPGCPGEYVIVCGERRWRAAREAGLARIPARLTRRTGLERDAHRLQVLENILREDLPPLDAMESFKRLMEERSMSRADLARLMGVAASVVTDILKLDRIAPGVRRRIRDDALRLSRRQLLRVAAAEDEKGQAEALERLRNGRPPGRTTRRLQGEGLRVTLRSAGTARVVVEGTAEPAEAADLLRRALAAVETFGMPKPEAAA